MTTAQPDRRGRGASGAERALVVELVGAAAVGKSTLVTELQRRDPGIRWLQRARWHGGGTAVARHAARFAPAWRAALFRSPRYAWRTARYFLRLAALEGVVRAAAAEAAGVVMLEHGPVFTLARLQAVHGGPVPPTLARYARRLLSRWAKRLDLVIALDAPFDVLEQRLRTRTKDHPMRGRSTDELRDFVSRYRAAYEAVLAELDAAGGPPVVGLRSDQATVEAMADQVGAAFADRRHAR